MASRGYEGATIEGFALEGKLAKGQVLCFGTGNAVKVAASSDAVLGVYDVRDNSDVDAAERNCNVAIVLQGPAQVYCNEAVAAGDVLVVADNGYVKPVGTLAQWEEMWAVGRALEAAEAEEKVHILVAPQKLIGTTV